MISTVAHLDEWNGCPADPLLPQEPAQPSKAAMCRYQAAGADLVHCLSALGELKKQLALVVVQEELMTKELKACGFARCLLADSLPAAARTCHDGSSEAKAAAALEAEVCFPDLKGILAVTADVDSEAAVQLFKILSLLPKPPSLLVVTPSLEERPEDRVADSGTLAAWQRLLEVGADGILPVSGPRPLAKHLLLEYLQRAEMTSARIVATLKPQLDAAKRHATQLMRGAMNGFLWDLAGTILESIPQQDNTLLVRLQGDVGIGPIRFTGRLGNRSASSIFKAEHPEFGTVAVKVVPKASIRSVTDLVAVDTEISIGRHLPQHPNIVHALGALHTAQDLIIISEFAGNQNLHAFLAKRIRNKVEATLPRQVMLSFLRQEVAAVAHLHQCMVCHRDLKPSNFIVSNDESVLRLTDTGMSERICSPRQTLKRSCGSLPFVAPEVLALKLVCADKATGSNSMEGCDATKCYDGLASDMWSLAANFIELGCGLCTLERMLDWTMAFPSDPEHRLQDLQSLPELWRACKHKVHTHGLHDLVSKMLHLSPVSRLTIDQVNSRDGVEMLFQQD